MLCGIPKVFRVSISLQAELEILMKSVDLQKWRFQVEKNYMYYEDLIITSLILRISSFSLFDTTNLMNFLCISFCMWNDFFLPPKAVQFFKHKPKGKKKVSLPHGVLTHSPFPSSHMPDLFVKTSINMNLTVSLICWDQKLLLTLPY